MKSEPNNTATQQNPVGRFMVAAGAVLEFKQTGTILLIQRSAHLDWHPNEWELVYGRLDQFEDAETALHREIQEEVGIQTIEIVEVLTCWHMFRGQQHIPENELIGITYHCRTEQEVPILSNEHQAYSWVTPKEALEIVKVEGIQRDIQKFAEKIS